MTFGIALGSNLGDRLHNLRKAMQAISAMPFKTRVLAIAPVYESIPVDCPPGSQNFFNTVVEIAADAEPMALLLELRSIEMRLGRPDTHEHHAPRVIDLDVLYADDVVTSHPELILPHPRL